MFLQASALFVIMHLPSKYLSLQHDPMMRRMLVEMFTHPTLRVTRLLCSTLSIRASMNESSSCLLVWSRSLLSVIRWSQDNPVWRRLMLESETVLLVMLVSTTMLLVGMLMLLRMKGARRGADRTQLMMETQTMLQAQQQPMMKSFS